MFSFGHPGARNFGGVGTMIDAPAVCVRVSAADELTVRGPLAERAGEAAHRVMRSWGQTSELPCAIEVVDAPRPHVGLGVGTQLALAVSRGLHTFFLRDYAGIADLARRCGRGLRSAIGLYGFEHGGLLLEGGKQRAEEISPLLARLELPESWRWVLATPQAASGLSGADEQAAFDRLPPVPAELTAELCREAVLELLPAAAGHDFAAFSRSLFRFSQMAGRCFATQQAGLYATLEAAELVAAIRREGIEGVGQSSWGPNLFALTQGDAQARSLAEWLQRERPRWQVLIAKPLNSGARLRFAE
jgi:beta-RFAP synthase